MKPQIENAKRGGYAALTMTLLVMFASLTIIGSLTFFSLQEVAINRIYARSTAAHYDAESGIEDAAYRLLAHKQIASSETIAMGADSALISVVTDLDGSRVIRSQGTVGSLQQTTETRLAPSLASSHFSYGVQTGNGGISMQNTSQVQGNVFSNGSITGVNSPVITGDALVAGASQISGVTINGNAQANGISQSAVGGYASSTAIMDTVNVGKDAHASDLRSSAISGNAFYQTIDADTTVAKTKFPGSVPPANLASIALPISDSALDAWESEAAAGGTISGPCPYAPADGDLVGPVKILCDLTIDNKTITVGGAIWVVGDITIKNTSVVQLKSSFNDLSSMFIADDPANRGTKGVITVGNKAQISGSGVSGSYLAMISRNASMENGGVVKAIDVQNSSQASVYYAPHGKIVISNSITLKEATGYGVEMKNSSVLIYESGLENMQFSASPSASYDMQYWKDAE